MDLNSAYMEMNVPGQEDYLAMVCAPDYNNLVTPSPHHYANDRSFFPATPTQIGDNIIIIILRSNYLFRYLN